MRNRTLTGASVRSESIAASGAAGLGLEAIVSSWMTGGVRSPQAVAMITENPRMLVERSWENRTSMTIAS